MKKYTNITELQNQKEAIKKDIKNLEELITFKKPKNTLSLITNGYTDRFLKEVPNEDGSTQTKINTPSIIQGISHQVKKTMNKQTIMQVANSSEGNDLIKNAIKLGALTMITSYAQKSMKSPTWKKKIIGASLLYIAPIAVKYIYKQINEYQKNKTTKSMEKLI